MTDPRPVDSPLRLAVLQATRALDAGDDLHAAEVLRRALADFDEEPTEEAVESERPPMYRAGGFS